MLFHSPVKIQSGEETEVWYFVNGKKTEAGRDRIVVIPPCIHQYVFERYNVEGTDLLFPQYRYTKSTEHKFLGYKQMSHAYFREQIFKPMMKKLGIAEGKVPYCSRHSYADKLKKAPGSDKDKAALIGHSDYAFTKDKYQSSHLADLIEIVSGFGT